MIVPMIVILAIGTLGRIISFTPQLGAAESQVLAALDPVRSSTILAFASFMHGLFSAPMIFAVIAALSAWLVVVRRSAQDAAGFAIVAVVASMVCFLTQQVIARPAPSVPGESLTAAETAASMPAGAVCGAVVIGLALLVTARHHARATLLLAVGTGVTLAVIAAALLGSFAYPVDVLAALPVAWAGIAFGCGIANRLVPLMTEIFGWNLTQHERKLHYRAPDRSVAYASTRTTAGVQGAPTTHHVDFAQHTTVQESGPITEEIPAIRYDAA